MFDDEQLEAILTRYEQAVLRRDAEAVVADYAPDAIGYDLAPPLQHGAETLLDPDGIRSWFDTWDGDIRISHSEPHILRDGDLGVVHCLQRMAGTKKDEGPVQMWFRATVVVRRIKDEWKIVHIHTSVPLAMDGSGKGLVDLVPEKAAR